MSQDTLGALVGWIFFGGIGLVVVCLILRFCWNIITGKFENK